LLGGRGGGGRRDLRRPESCRAACLVTEKEKKLIEGEFLLAASAADQVLARA